MALAVLSPAGRFANLARIIHEFPGEPGKGKAFLTEVTERTHRNHREVPEMFSVHSVVKRLENPDAWVPL